MKGSIHNMCMCMPAKADDAAAAKASATPIPTPKLSAVPKLPTLQRRPDQQKGAEDDLPKEQVSEATIQARKAYWAQFKKPRQNQTQTLEAPSSTSAVGSTLAQETLGDLASQPLAEACLAPSTSTPKGGQDTTGELASQTPEVAAEVHTQASPASAVPAQPEVPAPEMAQPVVPVTQPPPSDQVAEALKRLTTADLDKSSPPFSMKEVEMAQPKTAVFMTMGGSEVPVYVGLTLEQCLQAGLKPVSQGEPNAAAPPSPAGSQPTIPATPSVPTQQMEEPTPEETPDQPAANDMAAAAPETTQPSEESTMQQATLMNTGENQPPTISTQPVLPAAQPLVAPPALPSPAAPDVDTYLSANSVKHFGVHADQVLLERETQRLTQSDPAAAATQPTQVVPEPPATQPAPAPAAASQPELPANHAPAPAPAAAATEPPATQAAAPTAPNAPLSQESSRQYRNTYARFQRSFGRARAALTKNMHIYKLLQ